MQIEQTPGRLQNYWYIQQEFVVSSKEGLENWYKMQNQ